MCLVVDIPCFYLSFFIITLNDVIIVDRDSNRCVQAVATSVEGLCFL
jgi:hypothetical protein